MINTNYFSGVVKILEAPKEFSLDSKIQGTYFCVEIPQRRKNSIVSVLVWGNLGRDVQKFYKQGDYVLIEGHTSFQSNTFSQLTVRASKNVHVTVTKVHPILLNPDRTSTKI